MKDLPEKNPGFQRVALTFFVEENKKNFMEEFKRIWPHMSMYTLDDNNDLVFVDIPPDIVGDVYRLSVRCSKTKILVGRSQKSNWEVST